MAWDQYKLLVTEFKQAELPLALLGVHCVSNHVKIYPFMLHVWYIYLHLRSFKVDLYDKFVGIYTIHTWHESWNMQIKTAVCDGKLAP